MTTIDIEKFNEQLQKAIADALKVSALREIFAGVATINDASVEEKKKHYFGHPGTVHLNKIHRLLNETSTTAEDWFVCSVTASSDLINHDNWRWHKDALKDMGKTTVGCGFLLNHDWDNVNYSVGFIYADEFSFIPQAEALQLKACQVNAVNKKIIKQQGGCNVYKCWVAIASSQDYIVSAIKERRLHNVSTGGLLNKPRYICPLCSEKHSREVLWHEKDSAGNWICPHMLPGYGHLFGEEDAEMPYFIKAGSYTQVETSFVNAPNFIDCGVIR